jgi:uncharacterized protein (TIGR02421 family)
VAKLVPYVAVAPHGGGRVRRDVARLLRPSEARRRRIEATGTDRLVSAAPVYVASLDSRIDYDVELPEDRSPLANAGRLLRGTPPAAVTAESLVRHREVVGAVETLVRAILDRFGACLVFEITAFETRPRSRRPATFDIATAHLDRARWKLEIEAWRSALGAIRVLGKRALVSEDSGAAYEGELGRRLGALSPNVLVLPTAVRKVYMDESSGSVFPDVVRRLRRDLGRAMARVATTFARAHTKWRPPHSSALRAGDIPDLARAVDRSFTEVCRRLRLLRYINPINAEQERQRFLESNGDYIPKFRYRPLEFDPGTLKRKLYQEKVEEIEDPELERLYSAKRREVDLKIDLLSERGSRDFLLTSLKLFGRPEPLELRDAAGILDLRSEPEPRDWNADQARARLEQEVRAYATRDPTFQVKIAVHRGLASRAVTHEHKVDLRAESWYSSRLVEGLAQHEVGVHALTTHNGGAQPLKILRFGLPGSRRTQEGLAVFAEYRAGVLTPARLRTFALRALVVSRLIEGATFTEAVKFVREAHGFDLDEAYELVFRVFRGGGLTKDGLYLTGFLDVVRYWLSGRDLAVLCAGKVSIDSASIVRDLIARGVLMRPKLLPRFLDDESGLAATRVVFGLLRPGENGSALSLKDLLAGGGSASRG